ncbi:hypothetical protein XANCAGTX0491_002457 [Xanthoria calcicola]
MATGVETAGLILAAFPLVISALEHYENGFQVIREWVRFRGEFAAFLNALIRQRIFFRQNIEELLGPIVATEYDISILLDRPGGKAWADETLNAKLRQRLPGKYEYESYATTVSYIMETLHKLMDKLKIVERRPLWIEHASSSGKLKLEYELKRITYTLSRRRRDKLMSQLERYNNEIQTLLGNSERLEPMRKKRKSPVTRYFHQIRDHAHNLHAALTHTWRCDDSPTHTAKLLLEKRVRPDEDGGHEIEDPTTIKFNVVFAHMGRRMLNTSTMCSFPDWCAAKVELMDVEPKDERRESLSSVKCDPRTLADCTSQHSSNAPSLITTSSGAGDRMVSFVTTTTEPTTVSICDGAREINDLCSTLRSRSSSQSSLGYFRDAHHRRYILSLSEPAQGKLSNIQNIISLEGLLGKKSTAVGQAMLPRRSRLAIAGKKDIHFLQDQKDTVYADQPFLVRQISTNEADSAVSSKTTSGGCNTTLLCLGIIILELWFNERIEEQAFYQQFLDQEGNDNEYTAFNAAQKWQEQAMEEAGLDLHNATRRCIYCAFGAASQDLEDEELRQAVYSEVIQPLEKLHARFEGNY